MKLIAYVPGTKAWQSRRDAALCMRTHEKIQQIVDGEIGGSKAEKVLEQHVDACRSCHNEAEVIRDLKDAILRVGSKADPALVSTLEDLAKRLCEGKEARE